MTIHPIKQARLARGLSLRKCAQELHLGTSGAWHILRWEKGIHIPTRIYAEKLAEVLGFPSAEEVQRLCHDWQDTQQQT